MGNRIKADMGEAVIGREEDILTAYGIGSCVVVICYDITSPLAGMLHAILPEKPNRADNKNKYIDSGIDNLVKNVIREGAGIKNLRAKIFGGARMFDLKTGGETIGSRNIVKARQVLALKGIKIQAEDTGSDYGRTIEYIVSKNKAYVRSFQKGTVIF